MFSISSIQKRFASNSNLTQRQLYIQQGFIAFAIMLCSLGIPLLISEVKIRACTEICDLSKIAHTTLLWQAGYIAGSCLFGFVAMPRLAAFHMPRLLGLGIACLLIGNLPFLAIATAPNALYVLHVAGWVHAPSIPYDFICAMMIIIMLGLFTPVLIPDHKRKTPGMIDKTITILTLACGVLLEAQIIMHDFFYMVAAKSFKVPDEIQSYVQMLGGYNHSIEPYHNGLLIGFMIGFIAMLMPRLWPVSVAIAETK